MTEHDARAIEVQTTKISKNDSSLGIFASDSLLENFNSYVTICHSTLKWLLLFHVINPLNAKPQNGQPPSNCSLASVFGHFVGLAPKGTLM